MVQYHIQHTLVGVELESGTATPVARTLISSVLRIAVVVVSCQSAVANSNTLVIRLKANITYKVNKLSARHIIFGYATNSGARQLIIAYILRRNADAEQRQQRKCQPPIH